MKINQIKIDNFRSIYRQHFKVDDVNILLGENDVGKSNVLHALNLFFNPSQRPNYGDVHGDIESNLLSITLVFKVDNKNEIPKEIQEHLEENRLVIQRKHKVHKQAKYYDGKKKSIDLGKLRRFFRDKFYYIPTVRDAAQHEKTVELIHKLIDNPSEHIGKTVSKEATEAIRRLDRYMSKYLSDFTTFMNKNLGIKNVEITFAPDIEEILGLAKIRFSKKEYVGKLQSRGQGIQSLTLINLYRAWAHNPSSFKIIALEEPEAHLHPNLLRSFAQDLFSNTSNNTQIFLTTHSPLIVDQAKLHNIIRVVMKDSKTCFIKPDKGKIEKVEQSFYKYIHAKNSDIFFAKYVVLVEGITDKHFFTTISSKLSYTGRKGIKISCDFEQNGITATGCDGTSFRHIIPVLELFMIPWSILCDKHSWEKGTIISLLEKAGLKGKKPQIFKKLKKHYEDKSNFTEVGKLLDKFNIFCLNGCIEDFVITENSQENVKAALKKLFPKRFEEAKSTNVSIDKDFLKKVLKDEKPVWSKPVAMEFQSKDIHEEFSKHIICIVKNVNKISLTNKS